MNPAALLDRIPLPAWAVAILLVLLSALAAIGLRLLLEGVALRFARRTATRVGDVLIGALRKPVTALLFLAGLRGALELAELPPRAAALSGKTVMVLIVVAASYAVGAGLLALLREYAPRSPRLGPVSGFLGGVVRGAVAFLGLLVALDSIGISVTPVLASIGLGSVAVALALQETLGNFFSGIALLADRPVSVGEWVRIEPDLEGRVAEIGWRTTSLVDLAGNLVILPNGTLARSIVRNFDRPDPREVVELKLVLQHGTPIPLAREAIRRALGPEEANVHVTAIEPLGVELTVGLLVSSRPERSAARSRALEAIARSLAEAGLSLARLPGAASPPGRS